MGYAAALRNPKFAWQAHRDACSKGRCPVPAAGVLWCKASSSRSGWQLPSGAPPPCLLQRRLQRPQISPHPGQLRCQAVTPVRAGQKVGFSSAWRRRRRTARIQPIAGGGRALGLLAVVVAQREVNHLAAGAVWRTRRHRHSPCSCCLGRRRNRWHCVSCSRRRCCAAHLAGSGCSRLG